MKTSWPLRQINTWTRKHTSMIAIDRAIAQAISRWLSNAAARVRAQVRSSAICGGQSGGGADFSRVLRFPLSIFIPPNSPSMQSPGTGTVGQLVADMPSGPSLDAFYVKTFREDWCCVTNPLIYIPKYTASIYRYFVGGDILLAIIPSYC
jgi:hypothetical protein